MTADLFLIYSLSILGSITFVIMVFVCKYMDKINLLASEDYAKTIDAFSLSKK